MVVLRPTNASMPSAAASPATPASSAVPRLDQQILAASSRSAQLALLMLIALAVGLLGGASALTGGFLTRPTPVLDHRLDLNRASRTELALLPGIGPTLAERIEQHRAENGPFEKVDDLLQVKGIGAVRLQRIRSEIFIADAGATGALSQPQPLADRPARMAPPDKPRPRPAPPRVQPDPIRIDPNTATLTQLRTLPGIGPTLGQRIIGERARLPFARVEELQRVKGIGPKTVEKIRPFVVIESRDVAGTN